MPGTSNVTANWFSRYWRDSSDWQLDPDVFNILQLQLGPFNLDLYDSRWNHQTPDFLSWILDPSAMATNAFTHPWPKTGSYAFPPFALISHLLAQVLLRKISLTLMTPFWRGEPWFPALLELSHRDPFLLPWNPLILWDSMGQSHPLILQHRLPLLAWSITGLPNLFRI